MTEKNKRVQYFGFLRSLINSRRIVQKWPAWKRNLLSTNQTNNMQVKQVIVIRKDLNMRRGKECAQSAHASSLFLVKKFKDKNFVLNECEKQWLEGLFTKTVVSVDSEEELNNIYKKALEAGLEVNLVVDSGKTEFHGVPTPTCLAIGPDEVTKIDEITGHLKLR